MGRERPGTYVIDIDGSGIGDMVVHVRDRRKGCLDLLDLRGSQNRLNILTDYTLFKNITYKKMLVLTFFIFDNNESN